MKTHAFWGLLAAVLFITACEPPFDPRYKDDDDDKDTTGSTAADSIPGLIAYYPLDGDGIDKGPGKFHGVVVGSPTAVTDRFGKSGKAFRFGGTNTYVQVRETRNSPFEMNEAISISFWVKGFNEGSTLPGFHCCGHVISKFEGFNDGWCVKWFHDNDAMMQMMLVQGSYGYTTPNDRLRYPNQYLMFNWHHVVYTYSAATRTMRLYIDNEFVTQKTNCAYQFSHSGEDVFIGGAPLPIAGGGVANATADIALDDIRVYDVELNPMHVSMLFFERDWAK